jgi:hypothetical protein
VPRRAQTAVSVRDVDQRILLLRGERVLLGPDLAILYGVELRALTQAVKRNRGRFPSDFCFQLRSAEWALPHAFTEQGVAMLSSVLRSRRAVAVNVEIMRAFVRFRRSLAGHADLARRLDELEQKYDGQFGQVFDALRALMEPPPEAEAPPPRRIGKLDTRFQRKAPAVADAIRPESAEIPPRPTTTEPRAFVSLSTTSKPPPCLGAR